MATAPAILDAFFRMALAQTNSFKLHPSGLARSCHSAITLKRFGCHDPSALFEPKRSDGIARLLLGSCCLTHACYRQGCCVNGPFAAIILATAVPHGPQRQTKDAHAAIRSVLARRRLANNCTMPTSSCSRHLSHMQSTRDPMSPASHKSKPFVPTT